MNGELTLGIRKRLHQELKYVVKVQPSRVNKSFQNIHDYYI